MTEHWKVESPQVIDIGGDTDRVHKVVVALVSGHVDLVAHSSDQDPPSQPDDEPAVGAHGVRIEVSDVDGMPLQVSWNGSTVKIMHGKEADVSVIDSLKRLIGASGAPSARVSVSLPAAARVSVSTVSAPIVASGLRRGLMANTVSGEITVSDVRPELSLNTVSGDAVCANIDGEASINTVSGEVTVHSSGLRVTKVNTMSGDVTLDLRDRAAVVRSNSVSGDITVRAPFTGYAVSASTMTGQVVVDGAAIDRTGDSGARTARFGDEALVLKASSLSGDLVLLRFDPEAQGRPGPGQAPEHATSWAARSDSGPQDAPPDTVDTPHSPEARSWPTPGPQDTPWHEAQGAGDGGARRDESDGASA